MRDDYHIREAMRRGGETENPGAIRFFRTVASPDGGYPTGGRVFYAELQKNVTYSKTPGDVTIGYIGTGIFDYVYNASGDFPPLGTLCIAQRIGARWYITAVKNASGDAPDPRATCSPFDCLYPGAPLADCDYCPTGPLNWSVFVGSFNDECGDLLGAHMLEFNPNGELPGRCVFESPIGYMNALSSSPSM